METEEVPPEGALIEGARKQMRPKLSARKAAEHAGISEGRWRQIVKGYQAAGGGRIPVRGPAETVARMAEAVGVAPDQMREAGRPDVADEMESLRHIGVTETGDLWLTDHESLRQELREYLDLPDDQRPDSPPVTALSLWDHDELLVAAQAKHRDEMTLLNHIINVMSERRPKGGDGDAEVQHDTRGAAPIADNLRELSDPSRTTDDLPAVAHEDGDIQREQEETEEGP